MEILSNKKQKYGKQSAGIKKFRRHPYLQGIFESLSMQENLRVNRFTLVETFKTLAQYEHHIYIYIYIYIYLRIFSFRVAYKLVANKKDGHM